ncbi:PAS domain S-box-containing protein/diguanylate cyclase (GGDEF) domain-containing protein [Methylobacterium phyllostachyos]|uniref:PAS domain S-box-containing protein/diguanylate cyclase (GGDEF) domain-containing protein n=1 Tax=Methylobacterium phyllostachyos TaxID=582672 RepID=A0A1H0BEC6_9HYPH|nr:EAL domain-containing protein [Methylobacterium phyllostachyos]SDN43773.1 PAS domain S-box-containing protein/diguanylate cyclase (GGDEF) domain-containing protein [Methylobacterium phyllostachyos]
MLAVASNEADRLAALRHLAIMDTPNEAHFDAVCRLARDLFSVPIALVSLVDEDRQWFKAKCGIDLDGTERSIAFCNYTIGSDEVFVVDDATRDRRFATNPLVHGEQAIRFYAGAPLILRPGIRVGALCIKDTVARSFSPEQVRQLRDLAEILVAHLRLREAQKGQEVEIAERMSVERRLLAADEFQAIAEETARLGHWRIDVANRTIEWSAGIASVFGRNPELDVLDLEEHLGFYHPDDRAAVRGRMEAAMADRSALPRGGYDHRSRILRRDGEVRYVSVCGVAERDEVGRVVSLHGVCLDVTDLTRSERELRDTGALLRATLEAMDQGLLMTDADDRVRVHNGRAAAMMGVPESLLYDGAPFQAVRRHQLENGEFVHLPDRLRRWLELGEPALRVDNYERQRPNGTVLEVRTLPVTTGGVVRTLTDVTTRRSAERALRESEAHLRVSEERLALALDSGEDCLFDWDLVDGSLWVTERWRDKLGLVGGLAQPTTSVWIAAIHPEDRERVMSATRAHLKGQTSSLECEYRVRRADGSAFWVLARARVSSRAPDGQAVRLVGTLIDISQRKEAEARIAHMALHDSLTGLPNRNLFRKRLDRALRRAAREPDRHAVLALDLDRFKAVNDTYGHMAGDRVLCLVADRLRAIVPEPNTVARLGGDEFAVILSDIDGGAAAAQVCERIIAAVGEPMRLDGKVIDIGVSIGSAVLSDHGLTDEEAFKRADMALFEAKAAGRNTHWMFEAKAHARTAARSSLALDMKEAIRRGDFFLVYQPIIDVTTGSVVSFEALMRWRHPEHGLISPGEFIAVAEETGLIVPLGAWALKEACREAVYWPEPLCVSVNVSTVQFRGGLEEAVIAALASSGLAAQRLKLEVTESLLAQNPEQAVAVLHRLRAIDVHIALDDFGTGYSSMSYLRRFPFHLLKIDRAFIRDIADPDAAAIVRAMVGIGERLGMGIIAEGVETAEQLELVRREGCKQVQGYLFSKPLPAVEARAFARSGRAQKASAARERNDRNPPPAAIPTIRPSAA